MYHTWSENDHPLERAAIEYLDLYSLYEILELSGCTDIEVVAYLLKAGYIALPPFLEHYIEDDLKLEEKENDA